MNKKILKRTFTIEEVSEIAEVNSFTLRNWEDRYALFTPERDSNGRRIFSEFDTYRAIVAAELTKRQVKISKVVANLEESDDPFQVLMKNVEGSSFVELRERSLQELLRYDLESFQHTYMYLLGNYDIEFMADYFFYPLYRKLEDLNLDGKITPFQFQFCQNHFATRIARSMNTMKMSRTRDFAGKVLVTGFPENVFEYATLILYLVLELHGWQVIYGGPRTEMRDLHNAIADTQVDLAIIVSNNVSIRDFDKYESSLKALPVPVIVAGRLARMLLKEGRAGAENLEFSSLPPGPLARLLRYKMSASTPTSS